MRAIAALADVERGRLDLAAHALGQGPHLLGVVVAAHQQELVAAPADQHVGGAAGLLQHRAHAQQHLVARGVAAGVVDRLEVVEVDHHERQVEGARVVALLLRDVAPAHEVRVLRDVLEEEAAVAQAGQRVGEARLRQLQVQLLEVWLRAASSTVRLCTSCSSRRAYCASRSTFALLRAHERPQGAAQHQRVGHERPPAQPGRRLHAHGQLEAGLVPDAVVVGGAHAQAVVAGRQVGVGHAPHAAEVDPVGVEALQLVRVAVAAGRRVVERRELEGHHVVAVAEVDAGELPQRHVRGGRAVRLEERGQHHRRHVGVQRPGAAGGTR